MAKSTQFKCGGCGCSDYKVFRDDESGGINLLCNDCGSVSLISIRAEISVDWDERWHDNEGCATDGWHESDSIDKSRREILNNKK